MNDQPKRELDFGPGDDFSEILTNPFLDIAARVWDKPRYEAFRTCYRSMRRIDDLVDDRKIEGTPISGEEVAHYRTMILDALESLRNRSTTNPFLTELSVTLDCFAIPLWPWERLSEAMIYDLEHEGFASIRVFLRYAEGAAIAPATVFTHLCGVRETESGSYLAPSYDIRKAARPLALFSYLVHIIRDFQKDHLRGLNYFAEDLLQQRSLNQSDLRRVAEGGAISPAVRELIGQYKDFAGYYRNRARQTLDMLAMELEPRYQLSLEIIYGLYNLVFERIDPTGGCFTGAELNPPTEEISDRLQIIIAKSNIDIEL